MSRDHAIACEECRTLLGGYVLNALEPDEMETVQAHIARCAECSREHTELAPLPSLLDHVGSAEAVTAIPPAALEDAVLDGFARERPRPERRPERLRRWLARPLPVAIGAAAAAALVTLAVTVGLGGSSSTAHAYDAWLRGPAGERAYARLASEPDGTRVDLRVSGVTPTPGTVYELWCMGRDGSRVSAGTFRVDGSGRAAVRLTTAARLGEYDRLAVERLAPGHTGTRLMGGSIEY